MRWRREVSVALSSHSSKNRGILMKRLNRNDNGLTNSEQLSDTVVAVS